MIPFNKPYSGDLESKYVLDAINRKYIAGDGFYTKKCHDWLENYYTNSKALLTTSCTHALEMTAILIDVQEGDEIIMPSFTFVSTANAFVLRGAKIVFADIEPNTMNIDVGQIKKLITPKTKAIVTVHYNGVSCDMESIMDLADKHNLFVIEDAAQALGSIYNDKKVGQKGHFSCLSFHETKIAHCGEGGALIINDESFFETAEIIREKGTNRSKFFRGEIDKYSWVNIGSSYLPSELNAAFLLGQLEELPSFLKRRKELIKIYKECLSPVNDKIIFQELDDKNEGNNTHFIIKTKEDKTRDKLLYYLKKKGVHAVFHYVPLHSSPFGIKNKLSEIEDTFTTSESNKLIRLPLYYSLSKKEIQFICNQITEFFY